MTTEVYNKHNTWLSGPALGNLFSSSLIPAKLTHLEMVNCPALHRVRDHENLVVLLQRGLPLLQHSRFRLPRSPSGLEHLLARYYKDIAKDPEWHLWNVGREFAENTKSLDLALPFACNRVFLPRPEQAPAGLAERDWHPFARKSFETFPTDSRLQATGTIDSFAGT